MRCHVSSFTRRQILAAASVSAAVSYAAVPARADAATGIDVLDTPSLRIARPARVVLIAITTAGARLVAAGEHGVIIYSDDSGVSWAQASVPVDVTLTCIEFASPLLGWAAGHFGVILNTTDGGKTWQTQLNGVQANELTLAAARAASADGNKSLGAPFALKRANVFMHDGPDKPFLCLLALSATKVIVFGAYRLAMITTDGGKTWQDCSLQIGDALSHNIYAAVAAQSNLYLCGEAGLVFCSTDGGGGFEQVAVPGQVTLFGLVAGTQNRLLAFGVAGNGFTSSDRGKTWSPVTIPTQSNLTAGRELASGLVLIASEVGELFVSRDGGLTFHLLNNPAASPIYDLVQRTGANAGLVLVGYLGVTVLPASILTA